MQSKYTFFLSSIHFGHTIMYVVLHHIDGNYEVSAHVRRNLCYSICLHFAYTLRCITQENMCLLLIHSVTRHQNNRMKIIDKFISYNQNYTFIPSIIFFTSLTLYLFPLAAPRLAAFTTFLNNKNNMNDMKAVKLQNSIQWLKLWADVVFFYLDIYAL